MEQSSALACSSRKSRNSKCLCFVQSNYGEQEGDSLMQKLRAQQSGVVSCITV